MWLASDRLVGKWNLRDHDGRSGRIGSPRPGGRENSRGNDLQALRRFGVSHTPGRERCRNGEAIYLGTQRARTGGHLSRNPAAKSECCGAISGARIVSDSSGQKHPASPLSQESNRIVGLFPDLLGVGGVQEAGRQTAAALDEIARRRGWSLDLLGLNDRPGAGVLRVQGREIPFTGFGRAKVQFVIAAMRLARKNARLVLAAHPYL